MTEPRKYISKTARSNMSVPSGGKSRMHVAAATQEPSADELSRIQQKALQASDFYKQIGLSNGNLPRLSVASKSDDNSDSFSCPSKYGARWVKAKVPAQSFKNSNDSSVHSKTLPYKPYRRSGSYGEIQRTTIRTKSISNDQPLFEQPTRMSSGGSYRDTEIVQPSGAEFHQKSSTLKNFSRPADFYKLDTGHAEKDSTQFKSTAVCETADGSSNSPSIGSPAKQQMVVNVKCRPHGNEAKQQLRSQYSLSYDGSFEYPVQVQSEEHLASSENVIIDKVVDDSKDMNTSSQNVRSYTKKVPKSQPDKNKSLTSSPISSPKPKRKSDMRSKSDLPDMHLHSILSNIDKKAAEGIQAVDGIMPMLLNEIKTFHDDRIRRRQFAHYDWHSMLFSFADVLVAAELLKRKNTATGASKAASLSVGCGSVTNTPTGSQEDVSTIGVETMDINSTNDLVASCPYFDTEVGGEMDRIVSVSAVGTNASHLSAVAVQVHKGDGTTNALNVLTNHTYLSIVESATADNLLPPGSPPTGSVSYGIERVDRGATYYRTHFYEKDHQNFVGIDEKYGPIIISLKREKLEDQTTSSGSAVHQYRVIVRTCEMCTLRGSILEDAISMTRGHNSLGRGIHPKDVIHHLCQEVSMECLRQAQIAPKFHEQLMKLDEQNVYQSYKIGVLYCRAGQTTEEEMYNNEHGSPALDEFLSLLGRKVKLNGFDDFRGGLDVKTDSTGTESIFTEFRGYKIMFHVSTMLPFTPNNQQQLLRKRHIGNDIMTIVFQEPGSVAFSPKSIRSQFQHVFIVVRAIEPCTDHTSYRVAVTRARNIARFGPQIPAESVFPKSGTFREFLLTKIVNGENTAHSTGKFKALAMNTRQEYLKDMTKTYASQAGLDSNAKFRGFSISGRRIRDKDKHKQLPVTISCGAIVWRVHVTDYSTNEDVNCILGISNCVLTLVETERKQLIFSIPSQSILGWTGKSAASDGHLAGELSIYYGRGERISLRTDDLDCRDEILVRLEKFTRGSATDACGLRRNTRGELGFIVNYEGIIMEVEATGQAARDGIRQSSRLVEICKVSVATMTHEEIVDLLRTSHHVTVVIIPPNDDGTPRKCSMELYHMYPVIDVRKLNSSENAISKRATTSLNGDQNSVYQPSSNADISHAAVAECDGAKTGKASADKCKTLHTIEATIIAKDQVANNSSGCSSLTNTMSSTKSNISSKSNASCKSNLSTQIAEPVLEYHHRDSNRISEGLNSNSNNSSRVKSNRRSPQVTSSSRIPVEIRPLSSRVNDRAEAHLYRVESHTTTPVRSVKWTTQRQHSTPNHSRSSRYGAEVHHNHNNREHAVVNVSNEKFDVSPEAFSEQHHHLKFADTTVTSHHRHLHYHSKSSGDAPAPANVQTATSKGGKAPEPSPRHRVETQLINSGNAARDKRRTTNKTTSTKPQTNNSKTKTNVQADLIRLLTINHSTRNKPAEVRQQLADDSRHPYQASSSRRSSRRSKQAAIHRTVSDESLCGARLPDKTRYDDVGKVSSSQAASQDSLLNMLLPLPRPADSWDGLLDAACAAEAASAKTASMLSLNSLHRCGDAVDAGYVDNDFNHKRADPSLPMPMHRLSHDPFMTSLPAPSSSMDQIESEMASAREPVVTEQAIRRLEEMERELRVLREKFDQEQESKRELEQSKRALEERVNTLQRDNLRLRSKRHYPKLNHTLT